MDGYIKNNFGSRRGFYQYCRARILQCTGYWNRYTDIPFGEIKRLVFICNGNICRSPLAEAVARKAGFKAESFGLECTRGAKADPRAVKFAENNGFDISNHSARPIEDYIPEKGDLIIGMEIEHIETPAIKNLDKTYRTLLGLWSDNPLAYIHDPYNTNSAYFDKCENDVIERTRRLLQNLPNGPKA